MPHTAHQSEKQVPLAAAAEMCDRTYHDVWTNDLAAPLHARCLPSECGTGTVIVCFPDGTRVNASPLAARCEDDPERDFGLYMDPDWAPTWDAEVIGWPDFGLPTDPETAAGQIVTAFTRAKQGDRVEVGCIGGLGRTGTVLACMAVLAGVPADGAVEWVRANYDSRAVETAEQAEWILWFGRLVQSQS